MSRQLKRFTVGESVFHIWKLQVIGADDCDEMVELTDIVARFRGDPSQLSFHKEIKTFITIEEATTRLSPQGSKAGRTCRRAKCPSRGCQCNHSEEPHNPLVWACRRRIASCSTRLWIKCTPATFWCSKWCSWLIITRRRF